MTNDTKAPERIWAGNWLVIDGETDWSIGEWRDEKWTTVEVVEYIRADLHLSLVAAAYEDMTKRHEVEAKFQADIGNTDRYLIYKQISKYTRTLTPADAEAALEARDKRIRKEAYTQGVKEAARLFREHGDTDVVLALIEKDKTDD